MRSARPFCAWLIAGMLAMAPALAAEGAKRGMRAPTGIAAAAIDDSIAPPTIAMGARGSAVVRAQILLDRAWFSPGEIDGTFGDTMRKAIVAFQESNGLEAHGRIDAPTWEALGSGNSRVLTKYRITPQDAAGPFTRIPADIMKRGELRHLGYETAAEALAERFHVSPRLLRELNRGLAFVADEEIVVPDVLTAKPPPNALSLSLSKSRRVLRALDGAGRTLAQFPISVGSRRDELPVGKLRITTEVKDPVFDYNPALMHDAKPHHRKVRIAPGPNNPVGVVWMGLSKPHYGIHGTPEPSKVGRMETHGCIHLTNWDALRLATVAKPGLALEVTA